MQQRIYQQQVIDQEGKKWLLPASTIQRNIYDKENDLDRRNEISKLKYADTALQPYIDYLGTKDWTFFATMTTPYELTNNSARRLAERYYQMLSSQGCEEMFFVTEKFELKDGMHLHALMRCENELPFRAYWELYQIATGNHNYKVNKETLNAEFEGKTSRIQLKRFQKSVGAEGYCAKYILKAGGKDNFDLLTGAVTKEKVQKAYASERERKYLEKEMYKR